MDVVRRRERILGRIGDLKALATKQTEMKELPNRSQMGPALEVLLNFLREYKRKIYGGYAIDAALKRISEKLSVYDAKAFPDIDFYSPEPDDDAVELCNRLHAIGYKQVSAKNAIHAGTYKIRVEQTFEIADVTYCWKYMYDKIPCLKSQNGLQIVAPRFQIIDLYKTFVDPLFGWLKIEKNIVRAALLEKYYLLRLFPSRKKEFKDAKLSERTTEVLTALLNVMRGRKDVVLVGEVAYNLYMKQSQVQKAHQRFVGICNVTAYSQDIRKSFEDIVDQLGIRKYFVQECLPFMEKYGKSLRLLIDDRPVLTLYEDTFCVPFKSVDQFQVGSYHVCLRMLYIQRFVSDREDENASKKIGYMIHQLQAAREHFLRKKRHLGIEDMVFQELQVDCMGDAFKSSITMSRESSKHYMDFNPARTTKGTNSPQRRYPNTSGRCVRIVGPDGIEVLDHPLMSSPRSDDRTKQPEIVDTQ